MMAPATATRDPRLQALFDASERAILAAHPDETTRRAAETVFSSLRAGAGDGGTAPPHSLPALSHLAPALDTARQTSSEIAAVADALAQVAPLLNWQLRRTGESISPDFWTSHANAYIVGDGALEHRCDVWVGVSLMGPNITYVDHDHPPEEVYLALSSGAWWNEDHDWREPGIGGLIYNRHGVRHNMRSHAEPFLALWFLPID